MTSVFCGLATKVYELIMQRFGKVEILDGTNGFGLDLAVTFCFPRPSTSSNKVAVMPLDNWSVRLMLRNCSCDVNGISKETDQSYPILNAYLGEFEIDVVGFNQGMFHANNLLFSIYFDAREILNNW